MQIKVAPMGGEVRTFMLSDGARVSDALAAADLGDDGRDVRVNAEPATLTTPLRDGDVITLVNKVEGGK